MSPKITIVLLSYKRPQNIQIILEAIRRQTVEATVFLWNNGDVDVKSPLIDRYEQSGKNVGCMARWKLAKEATTPYVMSLDDDLCFNRNDALEKIIQSLERQDNPSRIIGAFGACFQPLQAYAKVERYQCRYINENRQLLFQPLVQDIAVDIVLGRTMAFRKKLLDTTSFPEEREDDIYLNATFANKARKFHRISALLNDAFYELPSYDTGNWREKNHLESRDRALTIYFARNSISENRFTHYIFPHIWRFIQKVKKILFSRK